MTNENQRKEIAVQVCREAGELALEFFGKPFPNIFDLAYQRVGPIDKGRVVMVGDSLHTDILGAQAVGIASVLVTQYGLFAGRDFRSAVANTGVAPEFVASRP